MTTLDASTRGRRNRANGHDAERIVARYLRAWWPDCCRAVRATHPDPGDLDATSPSLWWSVKASEREYIAAWMAELEAKSAGRLGILVVRRKGHASPGEWWAWLDAARLSDLVAGATYEMEPVGWPVRCELQHLVPLLVRAGYGREAA